MKKIDPKYRAEAIEKIKQADGFAVMTLKGQDFKCIGDGLDPAILIAMAIVYEPGLFEKIMFQIKVVQTLEDATRKPRG